MSFSSRRRNYLLTPHRRDGLIEWMKSMLQHSFVLDALETTAADTFSHFEVLIEEHRNLTSQQAESTSSECSPSSFYPSSRLKQLVPTIGVFHTPLPLRAAFHVYNEKHRLTKRKHIQISFNEIRHILNLAQIMALRRRKEPAAEILLTTTLQNPFHESVVISDETAVMKDRKESFGSSNDGLNDDMNFADDNAGAANKTAVLVDDDFNGPRLISFDGDQTLYSDGENFERNPRLAFYLYQLLRHGVNVAVVTAAGYEYMVEKYEYRLSGLLHYFQKRGLSPEECERFYLFGGECNFLMRLGADYHLHPVREHGPGGWMTATKHLSECPANWSEGDVQELLDAAQAQVEKCLEELALRGRAIRKYRAVGLVPRPGHYIPRESLDETVLRVKEDLNRLNGGRGPKLPYCAFNGGTDVWLDVGNKRVGVQVLQSYLGVPAVETLHIGDQFLNTGNDYAARDVSPCIWIISPQETTYILKSILRLANVSVAVHEDNCEESYTSQGGADGNRKGNGPCIDFQEMERRAQAAKRMDVYTGDMVAGNNE